MSARHAHLCLTVKQEALAHTQLAACRVPVAGVEIKLGGSWVPLKRSSNNQWPYYNTNGPWQSSFPMPIRITSAAGEAIEDSIPSAKGGDGTKQFGGVSLACTLDCWGSMT